MCMCLLFMFVLCSFVFRFTRVVWFVCFDFYLMYVFVVSYFYFHCALFQIVICYFVVFFDFRRSISCSYFSVFVATAWTSLYHTVQRLHRNIGSNFFFSITFSYSGELFSLSELLVWLTSFSSMVLKNRQLII